MKLKFLDSKHRTQEVDVPRNYAVKFDGTLSAGDLILSREYHKFVSFEDMGKPEAHPVAACTLVLTPVKKKIKKLDPVMLSWMLTAILVTLLFIWKASMLPLPN